MYLGAYRQPLSIHVCMLRAAMEPPSARVAHIASFGSMLSPMS